jgi:predicted enzyme related to lactoylglutathione lyase
MMSPQRIANRGEFAILADPEEAPFGVMHSSSGDSPDIRAKLGDWIWIGLFLQDVAKASKFYESLFGYDIHEVDERPDTLDLVLEANGFARAGIGQLDPDSDHKPTWLGFVRVEDLGGTLEKVRAAGGEVMYAPDDGVDSDLAIIADPFGSTVGLMEWSFEEEGKAEEEPQS